MNDDRQRLFCGTELCARIELAEAELVAQATAAGRARQAGEAPLVLPLAGGVAAWGREGSPLNKVAGLGFGGVPSDEELTALERAFDERHAPVRVELATLAVAGLAGVLAARGYHLVGFENVLGLRLPIALESLAIAAGVTLAESGEAELDAWLEVLIAGFATPDSQGVPAGESYAPDLIREIMRDTVSAEGFIRYAARRQGELAGAASLRLSGEIAQLTGAATLPHHRRQGVQSSLLAARLARATMADCKVAVVTTEPGSKSQENIQRQGFELLYTRAVLVREPRP
jgi:GNAT superfamily N-acetyltransferase